MNHTLNSLMSLTGGALTPELFSLCHTIEIDKIHRTRLENELKDLNNSSYLDYNFKKKNNDRLINEIMEVNIKIGIISKKIIECIK